MIKIAFLPLALLLSSCAPFEPTTDVHIVVIDSVIQSDVEGNLAHFPNTQTSDGESLNAFVLGAPLNVQSRVPVRVIAVHDQVGELGTTNTIIAITDRNESQENFDLDDEALRLAIGKTLIELNDSGSTSLGIRDREDAYAAIARYRDAYEDSDARRFIRSVPM
ncbi:MAG: hypothetical protein JJ956_10600 [Pseudomonadales bacterium]|nr:hypothetical protein [Pseudomonadales bacterium]